MDFGVKILNTPGNKGKKRNLREAKMHSYPLPTFKQPMPKKTDKSNI